MKKLAALAVAGALVIAFGIAGCSSSGGSGGQGAGAEQTGVVVGGWTANTQAASGVSSREAKLFDEATADLDGVAYEPIAVLAEQVVRGTNYAFLCKATPTTPDAQTGWAIVVVWEHLATGSEVVSVADIDVSDIWVSTGESTPWATGDWRISDSSVSELLPAEAAEAFDKGLQSYEGVDLKPVATLASQVVAGTNYQVLCSGDVPTSSDTELYLVTVYADLEGGAEFTDVELFNLEGYVG